MTMDVVEMLERLLVVSSQRRDSPDSPEAERRDRLLLTLAWAAALNICCEERLRSGVIGILQQTVCGSEETGECPGSLPTSGDKLVSRREFGYGSVSYSEGSGCFQLLLGLCRSIRSST
jgi:hypothetical protein